MTMISKIRIQTKIIVLLVLLLLLSLGLNIAWSNYTQKEQAENEMLEKTQILSREMQASWEFFSRNQERIDTDSDGSYNFKGIYCAVAGKSIAKFFMRDTDYVIRYVSLAPRNINGTVDEFEAEAFETFSEEEDAWEYYAMTTYDDMDAFRYVSPIYVEDDCLSCHGDPVGEIDVTGYPKEGLKVGDIAGAISIVMPVDLYMSNVSDNITRQSVFFFGLTLALVTLVYIVFTVLVAKPLKQLEMAAGEIEKGNLEVDTGSIKATGEIKDLAQRFDSMASQLKALYSNLEGQVVNRTEQLASANMVLEGQRIALEEANELLQKESEYKSDFLAIMSHELRTPLTAILAYIEIWERSDVVRAEKEETAIKEIKENGQFLLQMVNNILETARAEAGKMEMNYELIDMVDLISTVEGSVGFLAEKRSIEFSTRVYPDVPIFYADWEKLRRIIENLSSNAIKFTKRGGTVEITVTYDADDNSVVIVVADNGIGIKEDELPTIFDKFTQFDQSSFRRYKGSGLGLSVVREFVNAHHGSLEVTSTYKVGSTFTIRIPTDENRTEDLT
jgi:signal transduction histidine kinase